VIVVEVGEAACLGDRLLDDLPANVAGARRAGWHAVLVGADPQGAIDELDRLLASGG